jgi:ankyrin repeat protein
MYLFKKTEKEFTDLKSHEKNLFHLITKKDFDLFRSIIDSQGVDPNIRDHSGNTMLMHAVVDDDCMLFTQHLLIKGSDLNATDKHGMTAIFKAVYWGEEKSVILLLSKKNVDLELTNRAFKFELNPLAASIFKNHMNIAKHLLAKGADPYKAEKLIAKNYNIFKDFYGQEAQALIDFYKRWHRKKLMAFVRHLAITNQKKNYYQGNKSKHTLFRVEILNPNIYKLLMTEYL